MRKVFIDCGAHVGSSIVQFFEKFEDAAEYELFSFEVNPNFYNILENPIQLTQEINKFDKSKFKFFPKAVWIEDGQIELHRRRKYFSESSTIVQEKRTHALKDRTNTGFDKVLVDSIDFSKWLKNNFSKKDYIILKIDIEGAEYKVLEKMYEDGTMQYIDEIYGELHNIKCGKNQQDDKKIINNLKENNLTMYYWDASTTESFGLQEKIYNDEYVDDPNYPAF